MKTFFMQPPVSYCRVRALAACAVAAWAWLPATSGSRAHAFPPAPHHLVYGQVRDAQGNPFHSAGATVMLDVEGGSSLKTTVSPGQAPGVNYQLAIPLDMGLAGGSYKPTAINPTVPFRIKVKAGAVTYLPLEMSGAGALLADPAEMTRLDLTLGVDSDGDGLPDDWENALIQALAKDGVVRTLRDIRPEDDTDGDGMSNLDEYLAGTYAFDSKNGFDLQILEIKDGQALLEFTAVRGRSYVLMGSSDVKTWSQQSFRLAAEGQAGEERKFHYASQVTRLKILAKTNQTGVEPARFFRIQVK